MASHSSLPLRALGTTCNRTLAAVCILVLFGTSLRCFGQESSAQATPDKPSHPQLNARLSVLNAGHARPGGQNLAVDENTQPPANNEPTAPSPFDRQDLNAGHWSFRSQQSPEENASAVPRLGHASPRARPVAGDFNGDGVSEVALYLDGEWFIDLDGDGQWSDQDLYVRLGGADDQPLVGDWDGDGKDDIGVFGYTLSEGPATANLPDAEHATEEQPAAVATAKPAASPVRQFQRTRDGELRSDAVDHVFVFDVAGAVAVAGDFNGDGVDTLAVFDNGHWLVDVDGDGRLSDADFEADFGAAGDYPVVGDFTGDGVDEIGVFRNGTWRIDTNANHRLDDEDLVFELGVLGDVPVVADFVDRGTDQAAVYHGDADPTADAKQE